MSWKRRRPSFYIETSVCVPPTIFKGKRSCLSGKEAPLELASYGITSALCTRPAQGLSRPGRLASRSRPWQTLLAWAELWHGG